MSERSTPLPSNRAAGAFERRVARVLDGLLDEGDRVLIACSGGPDSLAALVSAARALGSSRVTAAHFDHRLRPTSEVAGERAIVEAAAGHLGVAVVSGRASRVPASGAEADAREARYRWLARACREAGVSACVTGHTLDDQAETVLMRLARGTAGGGAAGMAVASPWPVPARGAVALRVLRPLLGVTRTEVEAYLAALGIQAARDPSNDSLDYTRNRVRQQVLPALRDVNARAPEHLARFAEQQREDDEVLTALAGDWLDQHAQRAEAPEGLAVALDRHALRALPAAVARRAVWQAAKSLGMGLEMSHIEAILRSLTRSGACTSLPMGYALTRATDLMLQLQRRR